MTKKTNIYLPNEVLLLEWNKCKLVGKPSDKLILMFGKIAKGWGTTYRGVNYHRVKECVQYGTECAYIKWDRFDSTVSSNAFAYFTQMIKNDMLTHLNYLQHPEKKNISIDAIFDNNNHNK